MLFSVGLMETLFTQLPMCFDQCWKLSMILVLLPKDDVSASAQEEQPSAPRKDCQSLALAPLNTVLQKLELHPGQLPV